MAKKARPRGRPSEFTKQLGLKICERMADGESLLQICKSDDMPHRSTIARWLIRKIDQDFCDSYALARELQADKYFDECIEIADDPKYDWEERQSRSGDTFWGPNYEHIHRSRLRVDTRKWVCARMSGKYQDKQSSEEPKESPDQTRTIVYNELPPGQRPPEEMH